MRSTSSLRLGVGIDCARSWPRVSGRWLLGRPLVGLSVMALPVLGADQLVHQGGEIAHRGNGPRIGHTGGTEHTQQAERAVLVAVRREDEAHFLHRVVRV